MLSPFVKLSQGHCMYENTTLILATSILVFYSFNTLIFLVGQHEGDSSAKSCCSGARLV